MTIEAKKRLFLGTFIVSLLPALFLVDFAFFGDGFKTLALFARLAGIIGTVLLFWTVLLGVRSIVGRFIPDLVWFTEIHKLIGIYGYVLIVVHPVLIIIFYRNQYNINLLQSQISDQGYIYLIAGALSFGILTFIWLTSALLREKLKFRDWKRLHMLAYLIVPLTLSHTLGYNNHAKSGLANWYWGFLLFLFIGICVYQIAFYSGWIRSRYRIINTQRVADQTTEITLEHVSGRVLRPVAGQFAFLQYPLVVETHPYSISGFDHFTGQVTFTIKDLGAFSHLLESSQLGDELILDGPYGVFTSELYTSPRDAVIISGGIGITPFLASFDELQERLAWKQVYLFYGNREEKDIAYKHRLEELSAEMDNFELVHILQFSEDPAVEKGYITLEILQKYLGRPVGSYDFFVCGPPAMMDAILDLLSKAGVPHTQIHFEKFSN